MSRSDDGRPWTPVPLARGRSGAVVAPHHLATAAGLHVLRAGGNAVDAAIAANAVLAVVMPGSCGIGGDAFWLIWDEAHARQHALDGSGRAPAALAATVRRLGHTVMPKRGPLSITVPGAVRSWARAHERFGRSTRGSILAPAIDLAGAGFPADAAYVAKVEAGSAAIGPALGPDAPFFSTFRPHGRPWREGERVHRPALAATLATLAADGFDAFYDGDLGERQARGLAAAGSPITVDDLRDQAAEWGEPISLDYRGVRLTTHPPSSSGVVALEIVGILRQLEPPPPSSFGPDGVTDAAWIHAGLEASKIAMRDRDRSLADPRFRNVPVAALLDPDYLARAAASIDPARAAPPATAANPLGGGTVTIGVVDGDGNAVSLIESNYLGFGSGIVDPTTGIHYHDRGSYFSLEPGHPDLLEPGKRPLHTLIPAMLLRDRGDGRGPRPWIVVASMGADAQPQIHAQFVSAVVDGGVDVRTAVAAPRWYIRPPDHFRPPTEVLVEPRHRPGIAEALAGYGHALVPAESFDSELGHEHAIELVDGGPAVDGGSLAAATDPRSAGLPAVY